MHSSILARIPGFRKRIIPEPHVPSRGSQARGTRLTVAKNSTTTSFPGSLLLSSFPKKDPGYEVDSTIGPLVGIDPAVVFLHEVQHRRISSGRRVHGWRKGHSLCENGFFGGGGHNL